MEHEASLKQALQRLSELEIFEGLSESQLKELVAVGEISECPEDVVLFKEGDVGDKMYLIIEGSLEVTTEADAQVFMLNAGNVLGEIGLLDGLPRTATVTTASSCQLFGLSREEFESFISLDPKIAIGIMQVTNRKTR
ncbi:MAG: cyclic nucleotide-binding domain-containing protein, partial [Candidatus Eremiobacteraeota bacterium]|nr:cyclic nucleotide-binding domain-containing protein [Candidatus Eremiobacteraeota bacterium]